MENILLFFESRIIELIQGLGLYLSPGTQQAILILVGVFLFALLFGLARRHMLHWSMQGAWFGIILGIVITLAVESFVLIGARTAFIQVLKNPNTPKVIVDTLTKTSVEISSNFGSPGVLSASQSQAVTIESMFGELPEKDQELLREAICLP